MAGSNIRVVLTTPTGLNRGIQLNLKELCLKYLEQYLDLFPTFRWINIQIPRCMQAERRQIQ